MHPGKARLHRYARVGTLRRQDGCEVTFEPRHRHPTVPPAVAYILSWAAYTIPCDLCVLRYLPRRVSSVWPAAEPTHACQACNPHPGDQTVNMRCSVRAILTRQ